MCVKFILGNNRELAKRVFLYKPKDHGGLGAAEIENKLKLSAKT